MKTIQDKNVQVLILGAGFDTRWSRLPPIRFINVCRYVEVDYAEVLEKKQRALHKTPDSNIEDERYGLLPFNLLHHPSKLIEALLTSYGFCRDCRTVVLAECCFMYLPLNQVDLILFTLRSAFKFVDILIYEPILLEGDPFSIQMIRNFAARGIYLQSHCFPTRDALISSMEQSGLAIQSIWTMSDLVQSPLISDKDRHVLTTQMSLDEYEEWSLIGNHYYLVHLWNRS